MTTNVNETILFADDDISVREAVRDLLEIEGYIVIRNCIVAPETADVLAS